MATLTKRIQVLVAQDEWLELKELASQQELSVGHLIREAIAQTYFSAEKAHDDQVRLQRIEKLIALNLPVDEWEVLENELADRSYFDEDAT